MQVLRGKSRGGFQPSLTSSADYTDYAEKNYNSEQRRVANVPLSLSL